MHQTSFERVNRCVLQPIAGLYNRGKPLSFELSEAFVEELVGYDEDTLTAAMRSVRRTRQTMPSIAHLVEACEACKPKKEVPPPQDQRRSTWFHPNAPEVQAVMRSPMGQLALREAVGYDVWMHCWRDGQTEFTESEVRRFAQDLRAAGDEVARARAMRNPAVERFESLWNAMREREAMLARRFFIA